MATVTISLPDYLQEFVDAEIADRGVVSRAQFVEQLVLKVYQEKHHYQLEQLLLEGVNCGPATEMTKEDWAAIRREGLAHLANEKKNASKGRKKPRSPEKARLGHE